MKFTLAKWPKYFATKDPQNNFNNAYMHAAACTNEKEYLIEIITLTPL